MRPLEVTILDSPLLQRLRLIRQLGLVHLVYPAANHTRLEHSIGVVTQIDRLVESVNEHFANRVAVGAAGESPGSAINEPMRNLLRLTALCHDDLLTASASAVDEHLPPGTIDQMQNLIVGKSISDEFPLLQEFMSGPFDADKLDYMTRDAVMSGVPVVTDTERLVQKIRAVRVPEDKLPDKVAGSVGERDHCVMTGISMSGARAIDELMFGRVLLHDKLYRHHKVRAAEAMVASIFRLIAPVVEDGPAMAPFRLEDHQVLELEWRDVRRLAGRSLTKRERKAAATAAELAAMLRPRELFVRAFAFALDMPRDPYHSEPDHVDGLGDIVENSEDSVFLADIVGRIAEEMIEVCRILEPDLVEAYSGDFRPFVALDPPKPAPDDTDAGHAYLISEGATKSRIHPARPGVAGASRWSEAYLLTRETGYVFSTQELALYAYVASEIVLRRDHGVRTPETMHSYAKQDTAAIEDCKRKLDACGYFRTLPSDLAPLPKQLKTASANRRIDKVLENLRGYEGPRTSRLDKGLSLGSRQRVIDWLKQFGSDFGDEPLKLLEGLRVVGREQVVTTLMDFLDKHSDRFPNASVCPLGTAKDSSAITAYYSADLRDVRVLSVPAAVAREDPIVFIDDFIGSGQQAISILEAWFGVDPTTDLHEERGDPLSQSIQDGLRGRPLGFVFASGRSSGANELRV